MRESNFAFPAQNKACVCITSQLYDRRALDTTSPLPLFNSLTHLTYLTSTSPRIREIMTMDGGLERLVKILHEFCMCPPPPENPAILYGLMPPNARMPKLVPTLNPHSFDKHAAYRFSLAFQCIVNIGVRGNEPIRSRVVQAGTLEVVGCILEAWLANKGFSVGPSSSATGMPRETREQRQQRRQQINENRQREEAAQLQRALQRQLQTERREETSHILLLSDSYSQPNSDTDVSGDNSITATPQGSGTPTGSVVVPSRDRSGTIIARPVWDQSPTNATGPPRVRRNRHRELPPESPSASTDASRAETETEDDGDIDMDGASGAERMDSGIASASASPSPERQSHTIPRHGGTRRAVGIVSDEPITGPQTLQVGGLGLADTDAHIIINDAGAGDGGVGVEVGVEDGIVSLEPNDDFAMGAPPGAPGALGEGATPRPLNLNTMEAGRRRNTIDAPDVTPRAAVVGLPMIGAATTGRPVNAATAPHGHHRTATIRGRPAGLDTTNAGVQATGAAALPNPLGQLGAPRTTSSNSHHHRDSDSGPYRDEDVLLSLQLLAYLSKYPHVRQAFYKPRVTFHPASVNLPGARFGVGQHSSSREKQKQREIEKASVSATSSTTSSAATSPTGTGSGSDSYFRSFNMPSSSRGKDRTAAQASVSTIPVQPPIVVTPASGPPSSARQTNVFSLVERFTFKPSSTETDLPNPPPRLPQDIQYWAGVIMRNACRKDDSRGGIRQCANMMCGKWETYPREFAKCRRCRKAKYCGKECQSTAWSEGHRFWCSAKEADEDNLGDHSTRDASAAATAASGDQSTADATGGGAPGTGSTPRRRERHNHNHHHHGPPSDVSDVATVRGSRTAAPSSSNHAPPGPTSSSTVARAESSMTRDRTIQPNMAESSTSRMRASGRPPQPPLQNQNPSNAVYGSLQAQGASYADQNMYQGQRRRAETITGPMQASSASVITPSMAAAHAATMRAAAAQTQRPAAPQPVPPNVVPTMRPPMDDGVSPFTSPPDWSSLAGHTGWGVDSQLSPTAPGDFRQDFDLRRHRPLASPTNPNSRRPPPSDPDQDHMILG